jgi:hypothetical protein
MPIQNKSQEEMSVASALLDFGVSGSEAPAAARSGIHSPTFAVSIADDNKSVGTAVVTVASRTGSSISSSSGCEQRLGPSAQAAHNTRLFAPLKKRPVPTTSKAAQKRPRTDGVSTSATVVTQNSSNSNSSKNNSAKANAVALRKATAGATTATATTAPAFAMGNPKVSPPWSTLIIQDCHAVLGDRHCAGRTTVATVLLREIKLKYKEIYKGKGVDHWYEEAMADYYRKVAEKVPGFTKDDYETILVYSYSPKGKRERGRKAADAEAASDRIERPNCYRYHTDDIPKYGMAKVPEAVKFFFNSKDAPTLPKEISKYRSDFEKLKAYQPQPPQEKMDFFEDFLRFCEDNLQKAKDEEMAQQLLHSLNLIPTLRRLWDTLRSAGSKKGAPPPPPVPYPEVPSITTLLAQAVADPAKASTSTDAAQQEGDDQVPE